MITVSLREYPTDCSFVLDYRDYEVEALIEGRAWWIMDTLWIGGNKQECIANQDLLSILVHRFIEYPDHYGVRVTYRKELI